MATAYWIDGHLDLAYLGGLGRDFSKAVEDPMTGCVSLPDLHKAPVRLAIATIFTEAGAPKAPAGYEDSNDVEGASVAGRMQIEWYQDEEAANRIRIVRTVRDLDAVLSDGRSDAPLGVVLLMEGSDPIRTPGSAEWWFDHGVRIVGMSSAHGSRYSGGNTDSPTKDGGITPLGKALVAALDGLGILHDASHLSDASLKDLLALTNRRVIATHSNARALLEPSERHLTDEQIKAIGARGGIVGLNLCGKFLAVGREATIDDCVAHIERVASLIGRDRCVLGSDLDGGFAPTALPVGLRHPRDFEKLIEALFAKGWSTAEVNGFRSQNWVRVLRATLPA